MQQIKLSTYPEEIPDTLEVRDFEDEGQYYRIIMEIQSVLQADHFVMTAQCFEMNSDGSFKQAPNGYPSRSNSSPHTVHKDDLGDTVEMDDAWCRYTGSVDVDLLISLKHTTSKPSEPGLKYGDLVWDESAQAGVGQAWVWKEGFADSTARAKIENLKKVLRTSSIHSGFGFRRS